VSRYRKEFSKETKRQAIERSGHRCESVLVCSLADIGCSRELRIGDFNYDHISAEAISHDNSLENCAVLCCDCHNIKSREHDIPAIAQDKRVSDLAHGIKDPWRRRLVGGRDSPVRIRVVGGAVDRKTGLPWRGSQ
jgi:5-methylcytosine-specific restriction enzyme A